MTRLVLSAVEGIPRICNDKRAVVPSFYEFLCVLLWLIHCLEFVAGLALGEPEELLDPANEVRSMLGFA